MVRNLSKKVRRILTIALAVIFLSSAGVVIYQLFQYREGDEAYTEAEELVQLPELPEPEPPELVPLPELVLPEPELERRCLPGLQPLFPLWGRKELSRSWQCNTCGFTLCVLR